MLSDLSKTIIVVPCYNEELRLDEDTFRDFALQHPEIILLLVDDGSTDNTWTMLKRLAAADNIQALKLPRNQGKAEAVRQGFLAAAGEEADFLGFWDSDLATPLSEIVTFRAALLKDEALFMVTGCRLMRLGSNIRRKPLRHYLGRIFASIVSCHLRLPVYDTQCGAKILRRTAAEEAMRRPFASKWFFDVEMYKRLIGKFGRDAVLNGVLEYPLPQWQEKPGSKLKLAGALWELLKVLNSGN